MLLSEIGLGCKMSLQDLFDVNFIQVMENIKDERTNRLDKREIVIKIRLQPSDKSNDMTIAYDVTSKLAALEGGGFRVDIDDMGRSVCGERLPGQVDIRELD